MKRIAYGPWPSDKSIVYGAPAQGIDQSLLSAGRTESFEIEGEGPHHIEFFREVGLFAPSNAFSDLPPKNEEPGFEPTPWDVLDQSEWLLHIMRSSDDQHLFTLDSVGVLPHNNPQLEARYGSNATTLQHAVVLPQNLAGETVYLQIIPKRYGPTPHGMHVIELYSWVNYSLTYNNFGGRMGNDADLREIYYDKVTERFDAVKTASGWIPETRYLQLTDEQFDQLQRRYMDPQVHNGDTLWFEHNTKAQTLISRGQNADGTPKTRVVNIDAIHIEQVSPQPLENSSVTITVNLVQSINLSIHLANIAGRVIQDCWQGQMAAGRHAIKLNLEVSGLANGTYMLIAQDVNGEFAASIPLQFRP